MRTFPLTLDTVAPCAPLNTWWSDMRREFWRVAAISMVSARQTFLQSPDGRGAKVHSVQRVEADDVCLCTKVGDVVFGSTAL